MCHGQNMIKHGYIANLRGMVINPFLILLVGICRTTVWIPRLDDRPAIFLRWQTCELVTFPDASLNQRQEARNHTHSAEIAAATQCLHFTGLRDVLCLSRLFEDVRRCSKYIAHGPKKNASLFSVRQLSRPAVIHLTQPWPRARTQV